MYAPAHAAATPARTAIAMAGLGPTGRTSNVSYAELEAEANRLAHLLRRHGLARGDHIAIVSSNAIPMLEVEAAAERTGLYYTLVNTHLHPDEVAYQLADSGARLVFASSDLTGLAEAAVRHCDAVEARYVLDGPAPPGWRRLAVDHLPATPVDHEQLGAPMFYSSGTTGRPKGVLRPLPDADPTAVLPGRQFLATLFSFRPGMTYCSPAPLYHSAPQAALSTAIRLGATVVVMEHFDPEGWLALVTAHRVTHCQMVPTMLGRLLRLPESVRRRYDLSSLECVVHASAPCPVHLKRAAIEWLGPIVTEYYAATEANGFTHCTSAEWLAHPGTVGRSSRLEILDDEGQPCPTGVDGTIWFRGSAGFEYLNNGGATAASRDAGNTRTTVGDVGHVDADGYLYLTDRRSFMIISGGVNIYPQEIENVLSAHPSVADVAVFGVPDDDMGEAVKAVVQLAAAASEADLIGWCRERLAHFKCPRSVDFADELPRSETGKLYKRLLRDRYWQ